MTGSEISREGSSPASTPTAATPIYVDGCFVAHWEWDRSILEAMLAGGVTAANGNRINWEGFTETMTFLAKAKAFIDENADLARFIYATDDISDAKRDGRVGVILGFQNASPLDDKLYFLRLFRELGLRVLQLTYSTATSVGGGCWESHDLPLTDFGYDLVSELNRLGILIDLSHCSARTAADAVVASTQPVAYTHVCSAALCPHPRNKTDEQMQAVADRGGMIGVTFERTYLKAGYDSTVDDYVEAIEHVLSVAGEEHVGIGTDFQLGISDTVEHVSRDKGYGRYYEPGWDSEAHIASTTLVPAAPAGVTDLSTQAADLVSAMERRRWTEERIVRVLGGNWLRLFREVWGA